MRVPRLYVDAHLTGAAELALPPEAANHVARVLRLRPGAQLRLFDGRGGEFAALLTECGKGGASVRLGERITADPESPLSITLVQGISRGERMDYTLQKAVELGVRRIVPVSTERTVVQLAGERIESRMRHWRGVVASACEQCGRNRLPELLPPLPLADRLAQPRADLGLVLDPRAEATLPQLPAAAAVSLLIGPEGGLSEVEMELARRAGYQGVRLGPRILRTETAAVAAMAALQLLWGDFGAP